MILNLGNSVYRHSILEITAGMIGIIVLLILPSALEFNWRIIDTTTVEDAKYISIMADIFIITIAVILLFMQAANIVRYIIPDSRLTRSKALTSLLRGSSVRSEFGIKQAATLKVHQMIKNAYDLHQPDPNQKVVDKLEDEEENENIDALMNFTKVSEKRETCGGFFWAWRMMTSGNLIENEGVW